MKRNMIFLSPDNGDSGGSKGLDALGPVQTDLVPGDATAGDLEVQRQNELEQEEEETEETGDKKVVKKEEDKQKPVVVDAAELAKQFGGVIAEHFKKPEDEVSKKKKYDELSQEEREKIIDLWEPTKDWQAKYDNLETREEALKEMRNGMTKSAATISKLRVDELREELNGTLEETRNYLRSMQNAAAEERLAKAYPDLAKPELQPVVKAVSDQLVQGGAKFANEKALFDALAEGVTSVMHAGGATNFKLSSGSNPVNKQTKAKANPNAITVTTPGAGGQAGGKTQVVEKSRAIAIFDK